MGYDLHIHRRSSWFHDGDDIAQSEWEGLCTSDASLEITGKATATVPHTGEVICIESAGMALWTDGAASTWFWLDRGEIATSGADPQVIAKACQIAELLSARVQGDEGEFYRKDGTHYREDD